MYGQDAITKYSSTFVNMYYSPWQMAPADKPKSYVKLVCVGDEQRVVGLHMIGMAADEIVRTFYLWRMSLRSCVSQDHLSSCTFSS